MIEYKWNSLCIHARNLQGYNSLLGFTIFALNYETAKILHSRYIGNDEYIEGNREKRGWSWRRWLFSWHRHTKHWLHRATPSYSTAGLWFFSLFLSFICCPCYCWCCWCTFYLYHLHFSSVCFGNHRKIQAMLKKPNPRSAGPEMGHNWWNGCSVYKSQHITAAAETLSLVFFIAWGRKTGKGALRSILTSDVLGTYI